VRTVRATGAAVSDFVKVAGEADLWEVHFQRGIVGETDVQIESGAVINSTENQEIGRVTSAVISPRLGSIGLGYVRYEQLTEGTRVIVSDGIEATVTALPFLGTNG